MVRRTRQSSFGVNPDSGPEKPEDRPGYRRNASTMSKISRRGNTSAHENLRDSSTSQFTGQINSHGIHLHVRVTAHPSTQQVQQQPQHVTKTTNAQHHGNEGHPHRDHAQYHGNRSREPELHRGEYAQNNLSPKYRDLPPDGRQTRNKQRQTENETGKVTSASRTNFVESRKSQQQRQLHPDAAMLPPIEGGINGVSNYKGVQEFPPLDIPVRQASFGTPTLRSPIAKPPTDRYGRGLMRDKTVSTIDSVKFPECSNSASVIRRRRKKMTLSRDAKSRGLNGKINEHDPNLHLSLTDLTKKLDIGHTGELSDKFEEHTMERSNENLDEEWRRYSSLGSNRSHEPVSIRKKIEQFKKWHEDQSREKTERLEKLESQAIQKEKLKGEEDGEPTTSESPMEADDKGDKNTTKFPEVNLKPNAKDRSKSARTYITWKTWRDVDESYAYNDAKKYIEENELMTDEKEHWIQNWIDDVDREFFCGGRTEIESSYSGNSAGGATV